MRCQGAKKDHSQYAGHRVFYLELTSQILISVSELNLRYGHFMATPLSLGIGDGTAVLK